MTKEQRLEYDAARKVTQADLYRALKGDEVSIGELGVLCLVDSSRTAVALDGEGPDVVIQVGTDKPGFGGTRSYLVCHRCLHNRKELAVVMTTAVWLGRTVVRPMGMATAMHRHLDCVCKVCWVGQP